MEPVLDSPYRPGFGARPAVMVGRDRDLARAVATLTRVRATQRTATGAIVLIGARGMGKTVTLDLIGEQASEQRFVPVTVGFDQQSNSAQRLAVAVAEQVAPVQRGGAGWDRLRHWLSGLSVEVNAGIVKMTGRLPDPTQEPGQRDVLTKILTEASGAVVDRGWSGLSLQVDELQAASHDDLAVFANALQDTRRVSQAPLATFAAGLPDTPGKVMSAATFAERFEFRQLHRLTRDEATIALAQPSQNLGVGWEGAGLDAVLDAAGGSPYLLQRMGEEVWYVTDRAAGDTITADQVRTGLGEVADSLSVGMFAGRFGKATRVEQELMVAIAKVVDNDGIAQSGDIALVIDRTTRSLGPARQRLIDKGLVESPRRGALQFTMPGFAEFVRDKVGTRRYSRGELDQLRNAGRLQQARGEGILGGH